MDLAEAKTHRTGYLNEIGRGQGESWPAARRSGEGSRRVERSYSRALSHSLSGEKTKGERIREGERAKEEIREGRRQIGRAHV